MSEKISIMWFRQDLRVHDNPALLSALEHGGILPVYILDDESAGDFSPGAASRWWLHHSLLSLDKRLGQHLCLYRGDALAVFEDLVNRFQVEAVAWNRCYEPWRIKRDRKIKSMLEARGIAVTTCQGSLLWEPWEALKDDDTPYRVFTPFYRRGCLGRSTPREPLDGPARITYAKIENEAGSLEALKLLPNLRWHEKLESHYRIGEAGAHARLEEFLDDGIGQYKKGRNFPAQNAVSRLSPHLHFGELSPNQVWHAVRGRGDDENVDVFCSELGWREFSYSLLYHFPELPRKNLQEKFDSFPWREDAETLAAWQQGRTGYPIVDAGMRELWQTGFMHNRVRMIVGSFLVKNLLLHWHHGERWFRDCLVDADLANNSASWQWIAGCGADAAPYFRIFNPVTQGEKFDKNGDYTRRFVAELKDLPDKYLFQPWSAPEEILSEAGVILGESYPEPVVDLRGSRERALEAFKSTKGADG